MKKKINNCSDTLAIAKAVQNACIKEAKDGFRDASIRGLCSEGAMEAAISAIQMVDVDKIVEKFKQSQI